MDFRKDPLRLSRRALGAGVVLTAIGAPDPATAAEAAAKPDESAVHTFAMTIEDTILTLVDKQTFHTFSFNGQTPGPLIHVREGDRVEISVENQTTLPHTIHWHGLLQKNNWMLDGVPDVTQMAIAPGDTFTYRYVAEPSGTMWYHCHVNVNEHVAMRGMWGPLIIVPKNPPPIEREVTKDYVLMFSSWVSKWADKPGHGGIPGDVPDYFTINAKSYPETQPIRVDTGDVVRLRLIGAGDEMHSIHIHGRVFEIYAKDGHPLPAPMKADTILFGPGERYDLILRADDPGIWMVHDHIDRHTVNGTSPMGGIMTTIEYREADAKSRSFYHWKDKAFVPDFYYEESLKKPLGVYENAAFKGKPAP
ncbi:MAG TPA: multicopper oxidase domain-containing protein [Acetobacteraceae bacterium]|nr:multicopper oxidase domain-containing protein [Acetobacteraceae bacterium]